MRRTILYLFLAVWISKCHIGGASSFWSLFGMNGDKNRKKDGEKVVAQNDVSTDVAKKNEENTSATAS